MHADKTTSPLMNVPLNVPPKGVPGRLTRGMGLGLLGLALLLGQGGSPDAALAGTSQTSTGGTAETNANPSAGASSPKSTGSASVKAIDFSLKDLTGKRWSLKAQQGRVVVVNFWASWCGPCRMELPRLQELSTKLKDQPVTFLAINVDEADTLGVVTPFVKQNKLTLPILLDTKHEVVNQYDPDGVIPFTALVDAKGYIRHVHQQNAPGDEKIVEQELRNLLSEVSSTAPAPR